MGTSYCHFQAMGMRPRRGVPHETVTAVILAVSFALGTFTVPAQAAHRFASCAQMHRTYAHGVARSRSAAKEEVADGFGMAKISRPPFRANKSLDADTDGVA